MSLVATLEALVKAGATPEMMLEVVRVHERDREDALTRRRTSDAARQQRQRDKKPADPSRTSNATSRDVTDFVHGHADTAPRVRVVNTTSSSFQSEEASPSTKAIALASPKGSKRPSRRAPSDWFPAPGTLSQLAGEGFKAGEIERALTRMRDHEFKTARVDWDATFRNWIRNDRDRAPSNGKRPDDKSRSERNMDAAFAGLEIVANAGRPGVGDPAGGHEPRPVGGSSAVARRAEE